MPRIVQLGGRPAAHNPCPRYAFNSRIRSRSNEYYEPGSPPRWRDRPLPFRVPFDSGLQIFDPNGYYMGSASTLIPLFRAVDVVAEDNADTTMDWSAVDFVLDRSSLRKLLRWARSADAPPSRNTDWNKQIAANDTDAGSHPRAAPDHTSGIPDFRLDLQLGGKKTALVERWDTRTCQYVTPPKYGCRSNFDEAATAPRPGCQSSKYHNRIVQYVSNFVVVVPVILMTLVPLSLM